MSKLLSRKDIAQQTGLSPRSVAANERRLNLQPIRINARVIRYESQAVKLALKSIGIVHELHNS